MNLLHHWYISKPSKDTNKCLLEVTFDEINLFISDLTGLCYSTNNGDTYLIVMRGSMNEDKSSIYANMVNS